MAKKPLLSICVPTYKREYIIRDLLKSIYSQNVDHELFEVCITDNSETDETKNMMEKEFQNIDNLRYKKVTCKGFLNSVEALKFGQGELLKLHNDYSIFKENALPKMLDVIKKYKDSKAEIFFSINALKNKKQISEFSCYNDFMSNIHYYATWSTSFTIWKDDFDRLMNSGIEVNYMYPHTTLLHHVTDKSLYVVDNYEYMINLQPKKKGGYNIVDNFVRIYLTMVWEELYKPGHIKKSTYKKIEFFIIKFVAFWYYIVKHDKERYTFTFDNYGKIIKDKCGFMYVPLFHIFYFLYCIKNMIKKA